MMSQWRGVKQRYPGHLVLFRVGDFYETFFEDAETLSRELEVVLTSRTGDGPDRVPMAGVPHHAADSYLGRLVRRGHRVVVCDQVEDPKEARGLVRREVTRVLTPGTVLEEPLLPEGRSNFLSLVAPGGPESWWGVLVDVSTGETRVISVRREGLKGLVQDLGGEGPSEALLPPGGPSEELEGLWRSHRPGMRLSPGPEPLPVAALPPAWGSFVELHPEAALALGTAAAYIRSSESRILPFLGPPRLKRPGARLRIDAKTLRHLEITEPMNPRPGPAPTLLEVVNVAGSPVGRRALESWLRSPWAERPPIEERLDAVEYLHGRVELLRSLREGLGGVGDLPRASARILARRGGPRDLSLLVRSLERIGTLREKLNALPEGELPGLLREVRDRIDPPVALLLRLREALPPEPPALPVPGRTLRMEAFPELREVRRREEQALEELGRLESREARETGIRSLKVGYNQVFGYYFEVTRPQLSRVPNDRWTRKQTLAQGERYSSAELGALEAELNNCREKVAAVEGRLYEELLQEVDRSSPSLKSTGEAVGELDALAALAHVARLRRWTRPKVTEGPRICIREGRHPILEVTLGPAYVPNDVELDREEGRLLLLTGPNMAGKSTYMRQIGLLVTLAQAGSFVPARYAEIGLVSSLETRMGFTDDQSRGKSSFMVEMSEVAEILRSADAKSLVLLDEVGRGTGTSDGMALAWAILRYLSEHLRCRTVVATHYYGLASRVETLAGARNAHLAVREEGGQVVFLRALLPGATDKSYGLHVAELAGLPSEVLKEARRALRGTDGSGEARPEGRAPSRVVQSVLWSHGEPAGTHALLEELKRLDPEALTPLEALQRLAELRRRLENAEEDRGEK